MNPFLPTNPPEEPDPIRCSKKATVLMELSPYGDHAIEEHKFIVTGEFEDDQLWKITEIECDFFLKPVERLIRKTVTNHCEDLDWEVVS